MDIENVELTPDDKQKAVDYFLDSMTTLSKITSPFLANEKICEITETIFKMGFVKGFHRASGENIIKTINNEQ